MVTHARGDIAGKDMYNNASSKTDATNLHLPL